jgi:hypothetical protein
MSGPQPPNPPKPSVQTPSETLRCPVCGKGYRSGELICPHCGFAFNRLGQTRIIDAEDTTSTPAVNRPLYESLHPTLSPITFEIGDKKIALPVVEQFTVGRNSALASVQPDVDLSPFDADELGVSRCHIQISYQGPFIHVTDLDSLNGTWLNGTALIPNVARLLRDGDDLRLARLAVRVRF